MIYFNIKKYENFNLEECWYITDIEESSINKIFLDIIICTYNREEYINKNIVLLDKYIQENKYIKDNTNILIIDNGQTLKQENLPKENFFLFYNINTGGSGGFARGMIESLKKGCASHVLLLDDDVELIPESIFRTISFLSICKNKYANYFIGGSMLDMDKKHIQHENIAIWDKNKLFFNIQKNIDLRSRHACILNNIQNYKTNQYQAWWYCVIPLTYIKKNGLPYPFFIRLDDVEYSLRGNADIIHMNGICIWHEPFYKKDSNLTHYLTFRNTLILSCICTDSNIKKILFKNIIKGILTFDYKFSEIILDAIQDYLKGPKILYSYKISKSLLEYQINNLEKIKAINEVKLNKLKKFIFKDSLSLKEKLICILTLNGNILFPFFRTSFGVSLFGKPIKFKNYYLKKKVIIINEYNKTLIIRKCSSIKFIKILYRLIFLSIKYILLNKSVKDEYKLYYRKMTTIDFWINFLNSNHIYK